MAGNEGNSSEEGKKAPPVNSPSDQQRLSDLEEKLSTLLCFTDNLSKNFNSKVPPYIDSDPKDGLTLDSYNLSPELTNIGLSVHIHDISPYIDVNVDTWKYKHSHAPEVMQLFINSSSICEVQQLKPQYKGNLQVFPANIFFISPLQRKIGVSHFLSKCKQEQRPQPTLHYSLNANPDLKRNTSFLSKILTDLKQAQDIYAYSLNNFGSTKNYGVAPLYSIKVTESDKWTPYLDSYTYKLFQQGKSFSSNKDKNSELYTTMKQKISDHINDINSKKPRREINLNTIIKQKQTPRSKRKHEKISPIMRKSHRVDLPTPPSPPSTFPSSTGVNSPSSPPSPPREVINSMPTQIPTLQETVKPPFFTPPPVIEAKYPHSHQHITPTSYATSYTQHFTQETPASPNSQWSAPVYTELTNVNQQQYHQIPTNFIPQHHHPLHAAVQQHQHQPAQHHEHYMNTHVEHELETVAVQ